MPSLLHISEIITGQRGRKSANFLLDPLDVNSNHDPCLHDTGSSPLPLSYPCLLGPSKASLPFLTQAPPWSQALISSYLDCHPTLHQGHRVFPLTHSSDLSLRILKTLLWPFRNPGTGS